MMDRKAFQKICIDARRADRHDTRLGKRNPWSCVFSRLLPGSIVTISINSSREGGRYPLHCYGYVLSRALMADTFGYASGEGKETHRVARKYNRQESPGLENDRGKCTLIRIDRFRWSVRFGILAWPEVALEGKPQRAVPCTSISINYGRGCLPASRVAIEVF